MARAKSLSKHLRLAREARGLTVAQVAERAGVTPMAVYNWETGRSRPRPGNLSVLCKVVRLPLAEAEAMTAA